MKILTAMLGLHLAVSAAMAQSTPPDLQLAAKIVPSPNPLQTQVVVTLHNAADHTLNFPQPGLFCRESPGSMSVISTFEPVDPASEQSKYGMGCSACGHPSADILDQVKDWIALSPGQSIKVSRQLSNAMLLGEPGTYRISIVYSSPTFEEDDLAVLRNAGIVLPANEKYHSNSVTYIIPARTPKND
jgi:hypothetical protein